MKLHLPKGLRAALVAALATIGFTLPGAWAEGASSTYTTIAFTVDNATVSWADYNISINGLPSSAAGGPTAVVDHADLDGSGIIYSVNMVNGGGRMGTNALVVDTWTNTAALDDMNAAMGTTLTTAELAECGYLWAWQAGRQSSETFDFTGASGKDQIRSGDTATFYVGISANVGNPSGFSITGMSEEDTVITFATETGDGFGSEAYSSGGGSHLTIVKVVGTVEDASEIVFTANGGNKNGLAFIAYHSEAAAPVVSLVWAGTGTSHELTSSVWNDGTSSTAAYSETMPLAFDATGNKTVTVSSDATAKSMEIQASGYIFENSGTLNAQKLTVASGASLELKGTGDYIFNKVAVDAANSLTIGEGSTMKLTGESSAISLMGGDGVANNGTFQIATNTTVSGSLTSKMGGTLSVAAGKLLTLGTTKDSHSIDLTSYNALVLEEGAFIDTKALKVDINNLTANASNLKMLDTKAKDQVGVALKGTTTLAGDLLITSDWKYMINIEKLAGPGNLTLTGGWEEHRAVIGDADIASITVSNAMTEVALNGIINLSGALTLQGGTTKAAATAQLTLGGLSGSGALNATGGITLDVAAEGEYVHSGTLTLGGQLVKKGEGTQSIGSYAMQRAIDVQGGLLILSGTFAIDAITDGEIVQKYIGSDGTESANGFYMQSGSKTVYTVAAEGAEIDRNFATFTLNGGDVSDQVVDGVYNLGTGTTDYTTLYVNTGTVDYTAHAQYSVEQGSAITTVVVKDGTTLDLGTDSTVANLQYAEDGITAGLAGTGTISAFSGTGLLNLASGARVAVGDMTVSDNRGTYSTGPGTLVMQKLSVDNNSSLVEFDSGTEIDTVEHTGGSITFGGEGITHSVTNLKLSQNGNRASTVNVEAGTTLHITGTAVSYDQPNRFAGSFSVSHWSAANVININGTLISEAVISSCDGTATLNVESGGRLELRDGLNRGNYRDNAITINVKDGATLAAGTTHNTDQTKNSDNMVVNLQGGSTFQAYYGADEATAVINKVLTFGAGTVTMDAGAAGKTLQLNSNITGAGVAIAKAGAGALELNGSANALYSAIAMQAGTLVVNGTLDASNIEHTSGSVQYFKDPAGEATTNGFAKYTGEVLLVTGNTGDVTVGENGAIVLDGFAVGYDQATGKAGGSISLSTFYINEGQELLSDIQKVSATAGVALADGAKLVADADMASTLSVTSGQGYLQIENGVTVQSTAAAVELSGTGTYALASDVSTMGAVTIGTGWTGTVKASGNGNMTNIDLNAMGREGSTVEFNGVTGYFTATQNTTTFAPAMKLSGDGLTIVNGSTPRTYEFAGGVTGEGDFVYTMANGANNQTYIFSGAVSGWTGAYKASGNGKTSTLKFYGSAAEVNADIELTAGTLNLEIGNGTDPFSTEFKGAVAASSIAVKENASARFSGELADVASLQIAAGGSLTRPASMTVGTLANSGSLTVKNTDGNALLTLTAATAQGGDVEADSVQLAAGTANTFGKLVTGTLANGASVAVGDASSIGSITGGSLTAASGTVEVKSATGLSGTAVSEGATLKTGGADVEFGTITLAAGATLAGPGTFTATGVTLTGTADSTYTVSGGAVLETPGITGTGTLALDASTLRMMDTATLTAALSTSGISTVTVDSGKVLTLAGTISNTGTLTLNGAFDVSNCTSQETSVSYLGGANAKNGFKQSNIQVTVVDGGTASGTVQLTYKGSTVTEMTGGKAAFTGATDLTAFYVNEGSEKVSTALAYPGAKLGTYVLADAATLEVDGNNTVSMDNISLTGSSANLVIDTGSTVTTDGTAKALTLKGAGTLALNSGVSATGVTLDDAWAGTVSYTAAQLDTLDGAWKTGSTVSLTGVTGSLGNTAIGAAIVLNKGTDDWGFGQTVAGTTTLNGAITGEGNLGVKSGTATSIFELNGNTADWTGNFIVDTAADVTLSLGGDAKTINGSVSGSNLTLKLKTDATLKSDSTVARVNATAGSLKVEAGKRLTVTDTILPDNIKLGAGASIAAAFMGGTEYGYMDGTIANETGGDQDVSIHNADITVTGATLCTGGGTGFTVDNKLVDAKLLVAETLTAAVALNNVQDSLEVAGDLEIGTGGSLKVANGTSKQEVVIGTDSTLTTSAGAAVDANLTLSQGTTADMGAALAMNGGALTLNKGITLAGGLYDAVNALSGEGSYVNLFTGVKALTLGADTYTEPVKALQYFTNLGALSDKGDYFLKYEDGNVFISFTPTTASTLTWNGTEDRHTWEQGTGSAENWLEGDPAVPTHFTEGDNANFTPDAAKKLVTIDEDITARNITVSGGTLYIFENAEASTITAEQFAVKDSSLGKKGAGKLVLDIDTAVSLANAAFAVQEGDVEIGTADKVGELAMVGSSMLDIAPSSTLTVATINADADSSIELDGTLAVANGSVVNIVASAGSLLKIDAVGTAAAGTLAVGADTYLYGLENHGTLDLGTHELTLMEKTAQGGNVTADRLTLAETGSTFGDLKADIIQYGLASADDATLDAEAPNLVVKTIAANGIFPVITLDLTETMHGAGSLAPIQRLGEATTYTLVHATGQDLNASLFTLGGALETLVQNGLVHADAGLVVGHRDVKLTIGGLDLTWYTGKDETEWGYSVVSGGDIAHGANTLNGVQHVVVDADRTVDVSGVGSEPGLRVRNITGASGRTIAFTGTKDDTVNLIATEDTTSSVGVAAENVTIQVGLKELDEMDPADYAALHVGDVDLSGATLAVTTQADFTVDTLNGNADSKIKGQVSVAGRGGAYRGGYEDAYVALEQDASQTLYAGEGLTVAGAGEAKLAYTGHETHMDGIEGIGMTVVLNDPAHDNSGTTLVLDNNSRLSSGTLVSGMSAINSALTLNTNKAPELVRAGSLKMDGSTLVINQDAADQGSIAMEIRGTAGAQGLCLALIGGQDTYTDDVVLNGYLYQKYYENARLEAGRLLVDRRTDFFRTVSGAHTPNGIAGVQMMDAAIEELNPQVTNPAGDLAAVMTALETGAVANPDRVAAAMAGSSAAALGHAFGNDVQRQLRAIRNRTTTMGLSDCSVSEDLPYINAWVNAEGDHRKLDADGTLAGYTLSSWGGTVGCDVDLTNRLTLGAAFTVMHGDFSSRSADVCSGDLDREYVSVFARYARRAWTNTLVATLGFADSKLDRTVNYGAGGYTARDDADGSAFGLLYELGYTKALNEDASTCLQPVFNVSYRHSSLGGYTEKGAGDAALCVGDADMDTVTFGLGARLQSVVGTSVYNRSSLFEGRVLLKLDSGDRDATVHNRFAGVRNGADTKSAEVGAFGVEVGAGITLPVAEDGGAIFIDVTGEFRSGYSEVNGTAGYRFNF